MSINTFNLKDGSEWTHWLSAEIPSLFTGMGSLLEIMLGQITAPRAAALLTDLSRMKAQGSGRGDLAEGEGKPYHSLKLLWFWDGRRHLYSHWYTGAQTSSRVEWGSRTEAGQPTPFLQWENGSWSVRLMISNLANPQRSTTPTPANWVYMTAHFYCTFWVCSAQFVSVSPSADNVNIWELNILSPLEEIN